LEIGDVTLDEGDSGTSAFSFAVTLAGEVVGGFTVPFATADGSATTADGDYAAASGTLTFTGSDGEMQTVTVTVHGDLKVETDETFAVDLSATSHPSVAVADGSGLGTITNDDSASVEIGDVTLDEGDAGTTSFTFTVTLEGDVRGGFTVPFSSADGSATTADSDYVADSGTLTFAGTDGETHTVSITVNGDTAFEPDETFTVDLGAPSNPDVTLADGSGVGTITNDDLPQADLSITKDDGVAVASPGDVLTYTIVTANPGPDNALAAAVDDVFPVELIDCEWICATAEGALCTGGPVEGDIADSVDLPAGSSVTYTANCTVDPTAEYTAVANTATVTTPAGVTDPEPGNNTATDVDLGPAIFMDGFESGDTSAWSSTVP
jgi:uncharacterized repeat protein (TIGR01451 family)